MPIAGWVAVNQPAADPAPSRTRLAARRVLAAAVWLAPALPAAGSILTTTWQ